MSQFTMENELSLSDMLFGLVVAAGFLTSGIVLLFRTREMQRGAKEHVKELRYYPFKSFADSSAYVPVMRLLGVASIVAGVFVVVMIFFGSQ